MQFKSRRAVSRNATVVMAAMAVLLLTAIGSLLYAATVTSTVSITTQTTTQTATQTTTQTSTQTSTLTTTQVSTQTATQTTTQTTTATASPALPTKVNLVVVADWGGAGYDAFILASSIGAAPPAPATSTTGPGPNNNNVTVAAGVPTTIVITNTDTAVLQNFTGPVTTALSVYNDTNAGQVALQYQPGQTITNLPISHTFTISSLNLNVPIPPDTVVTFTYTFAHPGVYTYLCMTPCGPGMSVPGYMIGYVIVK